MSLEELLPVPLIETLRVPLGKAHRNEVIPLLNVQSNKALAL